ncbi:MAG: hypothetical protein EXS16_17705 [Gemmataceae bacterium]|nr:hypothetical protein [Gemmataceae bacterium]
MYPHRIRLRGPWECEPVVAGAFMPRRIIMPARWHDAGLAGTTGEARFTRKFGYPGRADETEHIWITCDGVTGLRQVSLNGVRFVSELRTEFDFDATAVMAARNHLEVIIHGEGEDAGLWGEVAMEIRKDAFLADVRLEQIDGIWHVLGQAVGVADRELELYTLIDNRNADYRIIAPSVAGKPFFVPLPTISSANHAVRIELINVSTVWYAVEIPIPHWRNAGGCDITD